MELRHLRYFVAVAEELHVTRAAAKLGIAQPPLTQQIKALERELGVGLFTRVGRGVVLTSAGSVFLGEARAILAQTAAAARKAKDAAQGLVGRLNVGFTESASFHPLVTESFRSFRAAYPHVELNLQEGHSPSLIEALSTGQLDLAFARPPFPADLPVSFEVVGEESMVAAMPIDHPLASRSQVSLAELADERFILYPRAVRPGLSDAVIAACEQAGFAPKIGQEAPQLSSTINFVAAGMGVSIVPESMRQIRSQAVRYLDVTDLALKACLGLAGPRAQPPSLAGNFRGIVASLAEA